VRLQEGALAGSTAAGAPDEAKTEPEATEAADAMPTPLRNALRSSRVIGIRDAAGERREGLPTTEQAA